MRTLATLTNTEKVLALNKTLAAPVQGSRQTSKHLLDQKYHFKHQKTCGKVKALEVSCCHSCIFLSSPRQRPGPLPCLLLLLQNASPQVQSPTDHLLLCTMVSRSFIPLLTHFFMSSTSSNTWVKGKIWLPGFPRLHPKLLILPILVKSYPSWDSFYSLVPLLSFLGNVVYGLLATSCLSLKTLACGSAPPSLLPPAKPKSGSILYLQSLFLYWGAYKLMKSKQPCKVELLQICSFPVVLPQSNLFHLYWRHKERSLVNRVGSCMESVPLSIVSPFQFTPSNIDSVIIDAIARGISLLAWCEAFSVESAGGTLQEEGALWRFLAARVADQQCGCEDIWWYLALGTHPASTVPQEHCSPGTAWWPSSCCPLYTDILHSRPPLGTDSLIVCSNSLVRCASHRPLHIVISQPHIVPHRGTRLPLLPHAHALATSCLPKGSSQLWPSNQQTSLPSRRFKKHVSPMRLKPCPWRKGPFPSLSISCPKILERVILHPEVTLFLQFNNSLH